MRGSQNFEDRVLDLMLERVVPRFLHPRAERGEGAALRFGGEVLSLSHTHGLHAHEERAEGPGLGLRLTVQGLGYSFWCLGSTRER